MGETERGEREPAGLWLARDWAAQLQENLVSMVDQPLKVETGAAESGERLDQEKTAIEAQYGPMAWWEQAFTLWPGAPFWIGAPEQAWSALATRILEAAGVEQQEPGEVRNTFTGLVGQSLGSMAHALGARAATEVSSGPSSECASPGAARDFRRLRVVFGDTELPPLILATGAGLWDCYLPGRAGEATEEAPEAARPPASPGIAIQGESRMLELLLDVELPVSISFGRTHMPLRDSLKLTTGSIVELNRGVGDPVDVIVNNCVIGRGEVVVIEGNYGVRIRQIMSREALLRNLR